MPFNLHGSNINIFKIFCMVKKQSHIVGLIFYSVVILFYKYLSRLLLFSYLMDGQLPLLSYHPFKCL